MIELEENRAVQRDTPNKNLTVRHAAVLQSVEEIKGNYIKGFINY